jgi:hypothetical protein
MLMRRAHELVPPIRHLRHCINTWYKHTIVTSVNEERSPHRSRVRVRVSQGVNFVRKDGKINPVPKSIRLVLFHVIKNWITKAKHQCIPQCGHPSPRSSTCPLRDKPSTLTRCAGRMRGISVFAGASLQALGKTHSSTGGTQRRSETWPTWRSTGVRRQKKTTGSYLTGV